MHGVINGYPTGQNMLKFHEGRAGRNSLCSEFSDEKDGSKVRFDATKGNKPEDQDYGDGIIRKLKPAYADFGAFPRARKNHHGNDKAYRKTISPNKSQLLDESNPNVLALAKSAHVEASIRTLPENDVNEKRDKVIKAVKDLYSQKKSFERRSLLKNDPDKKQFYNSNQMVAAGVHDSNSIRYKTLDKPLTNRSECVYNTGYCPEPDHDLKHFIKARAVKFKGDTVTMTNHKKVGNIIPKDWQAMPKKAQQYMTQEDFNKQADHPKSHIQRHKEMR